MCMKMNKSYIELSKLKTFDERFEYLRLNGIVGGDTFGHDRYLNQVLYTSAKWRSLRDKIIIRDNGCDLGIDGYFIYGNILIHHLNPITPEDLYLNNPKVFDPNNLICVSHNTHNAIHYGDSTLVNQQPIERSKNDTCPWRQ